MLQIVGLTASVGAGRPAKSKPLEAAMKHIQKLCAQLDCSLQKVVKEIDNLREYEKTKKRSGCLFSKYADSCCIGTHSLIGISNYCSWLNPCFSGVIAVSPRTSKVFADEVTKLMKKIEVKVQHLLGSRFSKLLKCLKSKKTLTWDACFQANEFHLTYRIAVSKLTNRDVFTSNRISQKFPTGDRWWLVFAILKYYYDR